MRMGCTDEVRDFLDWYAQYQGPDGNVPCAVDRGADCCRSTTATASSSSRWQSTSASPATRTSQRALAGRTARRHTWKRCARAPRAGIPRAREARAASASCRSRSATRAIGAAGSRLLGRLLGAPRAWRRGGAGARARARPPDAGRIEAVRQALHRPSTSRIETTIATRALSYVPGSVEWADFDPSATATAITTTDAARRAASGRARADLRRIPARSAPAAHRQDRLEQLLRLRASASSERW